MKTAYLVIGPESSGTRMMTKILIKAGCAGDSGHIQRWDTQPLLGNNIVWRRSVPHAGHSLSSVRFANLAKSQGYTPVLIIMNRDWHAAAQSKVSQSLAVDYNSALLAIASAYNFLYEGLNKTDYKFITVSYESLVQRPMKVLKQISLFTKLPINTNYKIKDGNAKWFK